MLSRPQTTEVEASSFPHILCWIASSKNEFLAGMLLVVQSGYVEEIECEKLGCVCLRLLPCGCLQSFRQRRVPGADPVVMIKRPSNAWTWPWMRWVAVIVYSK